jgi:hypothetical protein
MPTKKEIRHAVLGMALNELKSRAIILIPCLSGAIVFAENKVIPYVYDKKDLAGLRDLHYDLDQLLWMVTSKYDEQVIVHEIEHGSRYSCNDPECKICHPYEV